MIQALFCVPGPHRGLGGPILGFGGPEGSKVLNFHRGLFSPGDALSLTFRAFFGPRGQILTQFLKFILLQAI